MTEPEVPDQDGDEWVTVQVTERGGLTFLTALEGGDCAA